MNFSYNSSSKPSFSSSTSACSCLCSSFCKKCVSSKEKPLRKSSSALFSPSSLRLSALVSACKGLVFSWNNSSKSTTTFSTCGVESSEGAGVEGCAGVTLKSSIGILVGLEYILSNLLIVFFICFLLEESAFICFFLVSSSSEKSGCSPIIAAMLFFALIKKKTQSMITSKTPKIIKTMSEVLLSVVCGKLAFAIALLSSASVWTLLELFWLFGSNCLTLFFISTGLVWSTPLLERIGVTLSVFWRCERAGTSPISPRLLVS